MPTFPAIAQFDGAHPTAQAHRPGQRHKVLLAPLGTWGDVLPYVHLGRELQRRGHTVSLLTCELFEPLARREGFQFLPLLTREEYDQIMSHPQIWHPRLASVVFLREAVLPFMRRQYEFVTTAIHSDECDVLVAPVQSLGARVAHVKHDVPLATVHLAPYLFRSAYKNRRVSGISLPDWFPPSCKRSVYRFADFCGDQLDGRVVNAFLAELGLPRAKRVFWEWWNSPQRIIALFPEWFAAPQPDCPQQAVLAGFLPNDADDAAPLAEDVAEFLDAGPAPIVFTAGTAMAQGGRFFAESVRAARELGARAILLSQYRNQLPETLPSEILWQEFVPLPKLLRRVAAIVHHGGIGTTAQALAAGIPQVVVPMSFDQPDNAYRVESLGVGQAIRPRDYGAESVAPILKHLLTDAQVQARCREVATWCRGTDAPRIACDEIETLAESNHVATEVPGASRPVLERKAR